MKTSIAAALLALSLAGCCGSGDAACTQAQNNALGAYMLGGGAPIVSYRQPAPMITTTCTKAGCLSF